MKQGLGDKVETVTRATGIKKLFDATGKDCGCDSRREKLNNITLQRQKPSGCLTEELYNGWTDFKKRNPKELNKNDQQLICDIVREVWSMSFAPCSNCSSSVWTERMKKIDEIYNSYKPEEKTQPKRRGRKASESNK